MNPGGDKKREPATTGPPRELVSDQSAPVITLLTDFGTADFFVGAMKGIILGANFHARIVDITHEIPPQDIEAAAFTLLAAYQSFPSGAIHVAVVDPGVGSSRRGIAIRTGSRTLVGPDNGIFSYICEREPEHQVFHLTNEEYFRHPVSATFHGRDVFAPVAAAVSLGVDLSELGNPINDYVRLPSLDPIQLDHGELSGRIIHIDRFGNCVTNFTQEDISLSAARELLIKGSSIRLFKRFYSEASGTPDIVESGDKSGATDNSEEVFGIFGSAGFLEIAARNTSAARLLGVKRGEVVIARVRTK